MASKLIHSSLLVSLALNVLLAGVLSVLLSIDRVRFQAYEGIASKIGDNQVIFLGDSILARGEAWGIRLRDLRFSTRNMAVGGYTVAQIGAKYRDAVSPLSPCIVVIMGGINRTSEELPEQTFDDYRQLLEMLERDQVMPLVISTLYTQRSFDKPYVTDLNRLLTNYTSSKGLRFLDANAVLAKNSHLKEQYSVDGVHLTPSGYQQLQKLIKRELNKMQQKTTCPRKTKAV